MKEVKARRQAYIGNAADLWTGRDKRRAYALPCSQDVGLHSELPCIENALDRDVNLDASKSCLLIATRSAVSGTMPADALFRDSSDEEIEEPPAKKPRFFADSDSDSNQDDAVVVHDTRGERAPAVPVAGPSKPRLAAMSSAPIAANPGPARVDPDWDARYFGGQSLPCLRVLVRSPTDILTCMQTCLSRRLLSRVNPPSSRSRPARKSLCTGSSPRLQRRTARNRLLPRRNLSTMWCGRSRRSDPPNGRRIAHSGRFLRRPQI